MCHGVMASNSIHYTDAASVSISPIGHSEASVLKEEAWLLCLLVTNG